MSAARSPRRPRRSSRQVNSKFLELAPLGALLDKYQKRADDGSRKATHLTKQEVKPLLDRHYPTEWCKKEDTYLDRGAADPEEAAPKAKKCYLKAGKKGCEADYSIVSVTLALGRQLLALDARRPLRLHFPRAGARAPDESAQRASGTRGATSNE